jgi:hypothetical protein
MHEAVPVPAAPVPVASMQPALAVVPFAPVEFTRVELTVAAPIAALPSIAAALIAAEPMWPVAWARLRLVPPRTVLPHIHTTTGNVDMPRIRPATKPGSRCSGPRH